MFITNIRRFSFAYDHLKSDISLKRNQMKGDKKTYPDRKRITDLWVQHRGGYDQLNVTSLNPETKQAAVKEDFLLF